MNYKLPSISKEQFTNYRNTIIYLNDDILQQSIRLNNYTNE
jgi:hypothetical protein